MQACSSMVENIERYDPIFILRFSVHSLSLGYIEPVEFAGLGLLAVAFVSLSSSDDRIRKLGYEALAIFKHALEVVFCNIACFWYMIYVHIRCSRIVPYFYPLSNYSSLSLCICLCPCCQSFVCNFLMAFCMTSKSTSA